ncbi:hypothetical protein [Vibrio sp. Vb339]|uniref:hypothetical protein n=1 Tax=Vibrio sp. Vb339 TaxID=1192013 RepID=UPI001554BEEB|nr:hypothetical protein [Vibrio sp. Vb339]
MNTTTIYRYFESTIDAANYCFVFEKLPMIGRISFFDFISNEIYLKKYAAGISSRKQLLLHILLGHLNKIGSNKIGISKDRYRLNFRESVKKMVWKVF